MGQESQDLVASRLLSFLLLLQPGNPNAVSAYLKLLPSVLLQSSTSDDGQHLGDCRQLLSLALVHPAFPSQEKGRLRCLLAMLEEQANHFEQNHSGKWPVDQQTKWHGYDGDIPAINQPTSAEVSHLMSRRADAWKSSVPSRLLSAKEMVVAMPTSVSVSNGHGQLSSHGVQSTGGKPQRTRSLKVMSGGLEAGGSGLLGLVDIDGTTGKERANSLPHLSHSHLSTGDQASKNGVWSSDRPKIAANGFSNPGMKGCH